MEALGREHTRVRTIGISSNHNLATRRIHKNSGSSRNAQTKTKSRKSSQVKVRAGIKIRRGVKTNNGMKGEAMKKNRREDGVKTKKEIERKE